MKLAAIKQLAKKQKKKRQKDGKPSTNVYGLGAVPTAPGSGTAVGSGCGVGGDGGGDGGGE